MTSLSLPADSSVSSDLVQTPANDVVWFFVADGVWNELLRATSSNIGSVANIDRFLQR